MNSEMILESSWKEKLKTEFKKDYIKSIKSFLKEETKSWKIIYPKKEFIFNALNSTPLDKVKVVIIGQDPYHWINQAHGLSFSVLPWTKIPPSLNNIYKEINNDIWYDNWVPDNWDLEKWTKQWVLLLNAILTVEKEKPASHSKIGWETFTDKIIETISKESSWVVFLLWWAFAQKKEKLIDKNKHHIIKTTHPSPFSAHRWFLGSKCFSKTNKILKFEWKKEINW